MNRFMIKETDDHKYKVVERMTGRAVRFSFGTPLFATDDHPATIWNNYYSARGFADRLSASAPT